MLYVFTQTFWPGKRGPDCFAPIEPRFGVKEIFAFRTSVLEGAELPINSVSDILEISAC